MQISLRTYPQKNIQPQLTTTAPNFGARLPQVPSAKAIYSPSIFVTAINKVKKALNDRTLSKIKNYTRIDQYVARGGQPQSIKELKALKNDGVKVIVNFRTLGIAMIDFDEAKEAKKLGMKYVWLPMATKNGPTEKDLAKFSKVMRHVRRNDEKAYIHCAWGKDRTGFFSVFYKMTYGLDNLNNCLKEMLDRGHNYEKHPHLIPLLKKTLQSHYGITI